MAFRVQKWSSKSKYQRVTIWCSHYCLQKLPQKSVELAWVAEDKDWLSAWHWPYSYCFSYCPPGPWRCLEPPICAMCLFISWILFITIVLPFFSFLSLPSLLCRMVAQYIPCSHHYSFPTPPSTLRHCGQVEKSSRAGLQWPWTKQDVFLYISFLHVRNARYIDFCKALQSLLTKETM